MIQRPMPLMLARRTKRSGFALGFPRVQSRARPRDTPFLYGTGLLQDSTSEASRAPMKQARRWGALFPSHAPLTSLEAEVLEGKQNSFLMANPVEKEKHGPSHSMSHTELNSLQMKIQERTNAANCSWTTSLVCSHASARLSTLRRH